MAVIDCPAVIEYSAEAQKAAADELVALPDGSSLREMMIDYLEMRDKARACKMVAKNEG